jgi:hypothetical protein
MGDSSIWQAQEAIRKNELPLSSAVKPKKFGSYQGVVKIQMRSLVWLANLELPVPTKKPNSLDQLNL